MVRYLEVDRFTVAGLTFTVRSLQAHLLGRLWLLQLHRNLCRRHLALCPHVLHLQDPCHCLAHAPADPSECRRAVIAETPMECIA